MKYLNSYNNMLKYYNNKSWLYLSNDIKSMNLGYIKVIKFYRIFV